MAIWDKYSVSSELISTSALRLIGVIYFKVLQDKGLW